MTDRQSTSIKKQINEQFDQLAPYLYALAKIKQIFSATDAEASAIRLGMSISDFYAMRDEIAKARFGPEFITLLISDETPDPELFAKYGKQIPLD